MHSRKKSKYYFNMVEILLAIGILAFGFSSILGIFPVAVKIVRNSRTESIISDAVGNLQAYYYSMSHVPLISRTTNAQLDDEFWYSILFYETSDFDGTVDTAAQYSSLISGANKYIDFFIEGTGALSLNDLRGHLTAETSPLGDSYVGSKFLNDLKDKAASINGNGDNVREELVNESGYYFRPGLDLFQPNRQASYYYLVKGDENFENIDLTAQIIVWKSKMQKTYVTGDSYDATGLDYKYGVILNMEVSWPINVPYVEREKRFYQFTIANPRKR